MHLLEWPQRGPRFNNSDVTTTLSPNNGHRKLALRSARKEADCTTRKPSDWRHASLGNRVNMGKGTNFLQKGTKSSAHSGLQRDIYSKQHQYVDLADRSEGTRFVHFLVKKGGATLREKTLTRTEAELENTRKHLQF